VKKQILSITAFVVIGFAFSAIGTAQITKDADTITLERNGVKITVPRLENERLTYTKRNSKTWVFFTVKNTERPGRKYYSNISQEGSIAIMDQKQTLEELALKEKQMHAQKYTSTKISDFDGGGKLLVYEEEVGRDLVERRVLLWWNEGESIIRLDFTYRDFVGGTKVKKGRQFVIDTLSGLRVNGQPVPASAAYLKVLKVLEV